MSTQKLVHVLSFRGLLSPTHGDNTSFACLNKKSAPDASTCTPYASTCGIMFACCTYAATEYTELIVPTLPFHS